VLLLAATAVFMSVATHASADPDRSGVCSGCHSGVNVPVSTTPLSNNGTTATYSFSSPSADSVAIFDGTSKLTYVNATSGQFTVAVGRVYTVYAVAGPDTNDGIGSTTVSPAAPPADPPVTLVPVAGLSRFDTAIEASKRAFPAGLDPAGARTVVIATGRNWPDALGGTSLAGVLGGSVLLVDTNSVPTGVLAEITRLGATNAIILGGTGAVGTPVEDVLKQALGADKVERIAGSKRYATADAVAARVISLAGGSFDGTAFVATGANFPDALAAAPLAAAKAWPLFLADPVTGLSANTKAAMAGVGEVLILGGTGVVSEATEAGLTATYGSGAVERLAGDDRYATAATVAAYGVDTVGLAWDGVAIATGANFPDALAGGVLQGSSGSVMLLTESHTLSAPTRDALADNTAVIDEVRIFGGTSAVSDAVRAAVIAALG
jgi:putative cell wall-binding protein